MARVLRSIFAVITGFVVASVVMLVVESINGRVLYPELGKAAEGMTDQEAIRALMASAPTGALLVVLLGWALGSLVGGCLAAWIGRYAPVAHALVLGGLLTLAGIGNNMMIPPPTWFWIPTLLIFFAGTLAGARMAQRQG